MISLFKDKTEESKFIDNYQNPFQSDKCEKISFDIDNNFWSDYKTRYTSHIYFKNGDTRGSHKISADSFPELVFKTEQFIKSL